MKQREVDINNTHEVMVGAYQTLLDRFPLTFRKVRYVALTTIGICCTLLLLSQFNDAEWLQDIRMFAVIANCLSAGRLVGYGNVMFQIEKGVINNLHLTSFEHKDDNLHESDN